MSLRSRTSALGCTRSLVRLPAGYTRLKYIQGTGTQCINTNVTGGSDLTVRLAFERIEPNVGITQRFGMSSNLYYNVSLDWGYADQTELRGVVYVALYDETKITDLISSHGHHRVCADPRHGAVWLDGTRHDALRGVFSIQHPFTLFARAYTTYGFFCRAKLYAAVLELSGTVVRDMVPALDATGRPCMFDLITDRPFYNAGSGDFKFE